MQLFESDLLAAEGGALIPAFPKHRLLTGISVISADDLELSEGHPLGRRG